MLLKYQALSPPELCTLEGSLEWARFPCLPATFGAQSAATVAAVLVPPISLASGCAQHIDSLLSTWPKTPSANTSFVLFERGGCSFVEKYKTAVILGVQGLLVMDHTDKSEETALITMFDQAGDLVKAGIAQDILAISLLKSDGTRLRSHTVHVGDWSSSGRVRIDFDTQSRQAQHAYATAVVPCVGLLKPVVEGDWADTCTNDVEPPAFLAYSLECPVTDGPGSSSSSSPLWLEEAVWADASVAEAWPGLISSAFPSLLSGVSQQAIDILVFGCGEGRPALWFSQITALHPKSTLTCIEINDDGAAANTFVSQNHSQTQSCGLAPRRARLANNFCRVTPKVAKEKVTIYQGQSSKVLSLLHERNRKFDIV
jgi:hypothetical protein